MLTSLHIENIAVIKCADIDFTQGFTVLTGETGAGKSIIIDSINLLLGARGAKELIRTGESSALVSACFTDFSAAVLDELVNLGISPDEDGMLYLQRTLNADGKGQTRLNGRVIPSSLQRDIGRLLMSIHGQHDNQALLVPANHIGILDSFADLENIISDYKISYDSMQAILAEITSLTKNEQEKARLFELLAYQIKDIDAAKLKSGEEELLTAQRKRIQNLEKITKNTNLVYRALYRNEKGASASELIKRAQASLDNLVEEIPEAAAYSSRLEEVICELEDIAESVRACADADVDDPTALLNRIESRLDTISKLQRKYGATVEDILAYREKSMRELQAIEGAEERLDELNKELAKVRAVVMEKASVIHDKRVESAKLLEHRVMEELAFLEMGKVKFEASISSIKEDEPEACNKLGVDAVEFLIATNAGDPPKPLAKIASGGELSRIMLALKNVLADKESTGTSIFDEVDVGVSGKTAQKIGILLKNTSASTQVICITHSAQIAALADSHLLITKREKEGRVETSVAALGREQRISEIARIMGGATITDNLMKTAGEMLDASQNEIK